MSTAELVVVRVVRAGPGAYGCCPQHVATRALALWVPCREAAHRDPFATQDSLCALRPLVMGADFNLDVPCSLVWA